MLYQEENYKNLEDYLTNSPLSINAKKDVGTLYPNNQFENYSHLDPPLEYDSDMKKTYHYLFKYWWVNKQLEE
jgi:hypothetical protein